MNLITDEDIERLSNELRQLQNGANIHTINKAITYLTWIGKPSHLKDKSRETVFPNFIEQINIAINTKSTDKLNLFMRGWF